MHHGIILDVIIFLAIAVVVTPLCHRLKVSPILGYLLAGSAVGPAGLALIEDGEGTRSLAELGIVVLLFMIGLELSWERLKVIRHYIFGLGTAQVVVTGALAALVVNLAGMTGAGALVIGLALAFSSTAFVLQSLAERQELASQTGRVAVAVLILQDLAVVPLLVLIPLVGHGDAASMAWAMALALGKAAAAMTAIFLAARLALRPIFHLVAGTRSPEAFVAAALLAVIGTGFATEALGLSQALGAFLAGVMLASTEYRHQVEADLQPIRGLLMGLFFLTVGMTIDLDAMILRLPEIVTGTVLLLAGKTIVLTALAVIFRFHIATALHLGLLLAQGGEFAFIVLARAGTNNLIDPANSELIASVVALSMATTPLLAMAGDWVARRHRLADARKSAPGDGAADLTDHVILVGYGRVGRTVARVLEEQEIPYIAIDRDPRIVSEHRDQEEPVYFGDVRKLDVLKAV
ncbi:MAG TPA: monovalent cation:proton antiporter-2 (CPA2) family protein, partial [Candidatus Omnitrophota bacterium]|nr:monovalent cation:proton antiporter-2 (CPA2) family protein [Candidatus Omnitrophota bacterium]